MGKRKKSSKTPQEDGIAYLQRNAAQNFLEGHFGERKEDEQ